MIIRKRSCLRNGKATPQLINYLKIVKADSGGIASVKLSKFIIQPTCPVA